MRTTIFCKINAFISICGAIILFSPFCLAADIQPRVIELGNLSINTTSKQTINIENNEAETIILEKARSSCKCVTIEYEKGRQIQKQTVYMLTLNFATAGLNTGKFKKFLFFNFKNSQTPVISIEIKGNILPAETAQ